MNTRLELEILPQPNLVTCGPTSLHAVYRYYGDSITLQEVIDQVDMLEDGGTLAVLLALHALRRGWGAKIYTYNLRVFDPTWFTQKGVDIRSRLEEQMKHKKSKRLHAASTGYLEFLDRGGKLGFQDLTSKLIRRYIKDGKPVLTGLSSTYLYHEARELPDATYDDVRGDPQGHFVVLAGYEKEQRLVHVADPLHPNPMAPNQHYDVPIERVIGAIFLGILTYDANLLVLEPPKERQQ